MITVEQVRETLCISDLTHDFFLARLIEEATATLGRAILEYLGPIKEFVELRDASYGDGQFAIALSRVPVGVSKVEQRRSPFSPFVEVPPLADDGNPAYAIVGRDLLLRAGVAYGPGSLRVTYTSGYALDEGPAELRAIVEALVVGRYRGFSAGVTEGGLKSESLGDYSYTRFGLDELMAQSGWESVARAWKRMLI